MRIVWGLAILILSTAAQATPVAIRVCALTSQWKTSHPGVDHLTETDLLEPGLTYRLAGDESEALTQLEPFASTKVEVILGDDRAYGEFVRVLQGYLPVLQRLLTPGDPKILSTKLDRSAVGAPIEWDTEGCARAQVLVATRVTGGIALSGDSKLWKRLSDAQRLVYLLQVLINNSIEADGIQAPSLLADITRGFAPDAPVLPVYAIFAELLKKRWSAGDANPFLRERNFDNSQGRRDGLDDWLYSFTPWIRNQDFGSRDLEKFKRELREKVYDRASNELAIYFPKLSVIKRDALFRELSDAIADSTVPWCERFLKSGTNFDEFNNPYTVNSFWRAHPYQLLYRLVLKNSPGYDAIVTLK